MGNTENYNLPRRSLHNSNTFYLRTKGDQTKVGILTEQATEFRCAPNSGKAQRSGFDAERRHSGMSELSPTGGSEGYGVCLDEMGV